MSTKSIAIPEELRRSALAEINKCNKCGFCLAGCPTYLATGVEWEVARGRLALARAVLEGRLDVRDLPRSVWSCILCRNCRPHCPPGVEMDRVIIALRAALGASLGVSPVRRAVTRGLLPARSRLALIAAAGGAAQGVGLDRLLALVPNAHTRAALSIAPRLNGPAALRRRFAREGLFAGSGPPADGLSGDGLPQVGVFLGCATELGMPDVALALGRLLRELGIPAALIEGACCGLPAYGWGDLDGARAAASANLETFAAYDVIITPCASCASFLREYAGLFAPGSPEAVPASAVAAKVEPASTFLAAHGLVDALGAARGRAPVHTFHYPCHLSHYLGRGRELQPVLEAIPGPYIEMEEADSCCGAGGSYAFTHPEHSTAVLARKLAHLRETSADIVTTVCPGCMLQLASGLRLEGSRIQVRHLLELAAECICGEAAALG